MARTPPNLAQSPARESFGFLLAHAAHRFRLYAEQALEPLGLTIRHFVILGTLHHFGPVAQHQLGMSVCIDRSTMVGLIDDLERNGYVERRPDPEDRRVFLVHLTAPGQQIAEQGCALTRQTEVECLSLLTTEQQAELKHLLTLIGDLDNTSGFEHIRIHANVRGT